MVYLPNDAEQAQIREILARNETAVVVENGDVVEILGVANYPRTCREYYVGRLVKAVFRTPFDLESRLAIARAKASAE